MSEFNAETFGALRCMVNYAREKTQCRLAQAKAHAIREGFSQEAVDEAVKFWAEYEAKKEGL